VFDNGLKEHFCSEDNTTYVMSCARVKPRGAWWSTEDRERPSVL